MDDERLKLKNQLCFPLYVASKEVVNRYKPLLDELDLTYTQYITMMVLWEHQSMGVNELGAFLHLDSGTLTPLLKRLESKGYVQRTRSTQDERIVLISTTDRGVALKEKAYHIPAQMAECLPLTPEESMTLYQLLYKVIGMRTCIEPPA
jgi:DNA-binding MarR family transcriptional regulator